MTMLNDEHIQRMLEEGNALPQDQQDVQAYQALFRSLQTPPAVHISNTFARKVSIRIRERQARISSLRYFLLIAITIISAISITAGMLWMFAPAAAVSILTIMVAKKWILVFIAVAFTAIQLLDKRLLRKQLQAGLSGT